MLLTYAWIESQDTTFLLIFELTKFSNFCVLGNRFLLKKNNYVLSSLWIVMVQEPFLWPHWNYATQYQKTSESEYYGTYFLFARLNLLHWYVYQRKIFDSDFPSPCFDVPKASNFTSGGVQNRKTKNRRLGMIVMSFQDFKLCKKQISQSFSYCELINLLRNGTMVRCL